MITPPDPNETLTAIRYRIKFVYFSVENSTVVHRKRVSESLTPLRNFSAQHKDAHALFLVKRKLVITVGRVT